MVKKLLSPLTEITAKAPSLLGTITVVGAAVAIVGATALPSRINADGGTNTHSVGIHLSDEDLIGDEGWFSDEDLIGDEGWFSDGDLIGDEDQFGKETMVGDTLQIGDAAPATSGGGHINQATRRIGPFFVYTAFDQYGHPVSRCKKMAYLPHYNINVKRNSYDHDDLSILRFHVTPPDQNKRVILYESKTKTCVDISKRNLKKRIKEITKGALKDMANNARYLWEQAPGWGLAALAAVGALVAFIAVLIFKGAACRWAC